jgi:hypothetical protein
LAYCTGFRFSLDGIIKKLEHSSLERVDGHGRRLVLAWAACRWEGNIGSEGVSTSGSSKPGNDREEALSFGGYPDGIHFLQVCMWIDLVYRANQGLSIGEESGSDGSLSDIKHELSWWKRYKCNSQFGVCSS